MAKQITAELVEDDASDTVGIVEDAEDVSNTPEASLEITFKHDHTLFQQMKIRLYKSMLEQYKQSGKDSSSSVCTHTM